MLKRMKEIGATANDMLEVYILQIRCLTEIGCPAFNGTLTKDDINTLERIQKTACRIILGPKYISYQNALKILKIAQLDTRREKICLKFALKLQKNDKFSNWLINAPRKTRSDKKFILPKTRTKIYQKSPLFHLAGILNKKKN